MKLQFKHLMFFSFLILFSAFASGQTAVTDSGTVDNSNPFFKTITYAGTVSGTDTTLLKPVTIDGFSNLYDAQYVLANANDSIRVKVLSQVKYFTSWSDKKVLTEDSVSTENSIRDTVQTYTSGIRPVIIGGSDNGYTTTWQLKLVFKRE